MTAKTGQVVVGVGRWKIDMRTKTVCLKIEQIIPKGEKVQRLTN